MNSSQQPQTSPASAGPTNGVQVTPAWLLDDDVAFGCECADPWLQIERWRQEVPQPMHQLT
jgi:hypothetical protein